MNLLFILLKSSFVLILPALVAGCGQKPEAPRPNVIVFIADDISWNDFGCYGNQVVQTPNIDRIASEGVRFTNAYLTTSSCSPSRISIMTGRYPHNTGAAELHTEPKIDFPTIASQLKANGYYTAQAGKWHMGQLIRSGFDLVQDDGKKNGNGGEEYWVEALQRRNKDKPFFFWFASYDAHRIWGSNEFSGIHAADEMILPVTLVDGPGTRQDLAQYYDEIKRFDYYIGKVEEELKKQGVLENTVIIIMADNGRPFPRDKTRVYDSGIKTPFIVRWPEGMDKNGMVCHSLVSAVDIAPSIMDLCQAEKPESFQGRSFKAMLNDPDQPFRNYVFAEHNWHDFEAYERMVRGLDYMYIFNARPQFPNQGPADAIRSPSFDELVQQQKKGSLSVVQADIFLAPRPAEELFDCKNDSLQLNNLIGDKKYENIHKELKQVLETWMGQTGDNIPRNLTKDWFHRGTGERIDEKDNIRGDMPGIANGADKINDPGVF